MFQFKKCFSLVDKPNKKEKRFPSAELLQQACYQDYCRLINTYDFIYNKINFASAFAVALMMVIIKDIEISLWFMQSDDTPCKELIHDSVLSIVSIISAALIIFAVIKLLWLSKSKKIMVFDSRAIRTESIYELQNDESALWLIAKYTKAINDLKDNIEIKQKGFDCAIMSIICSLIMYIITILMRKVTI